MSEILDLEQTFLSLTGDGRADLLPGEHFGVRLSHAPADMAYLVGVYPFTDDWPHWEMHPKGHEILVFLEGRLEMTLEENGRRRVVEVGIDEMCARARAAGARIQREPADQPYGDRVFTCLDPEGHSWSFGQEVQPTTPEEWDRATGATTTGSRR